jgi:DNA-binding NarL/FixJ family response regulator
MPNSKPRIILADDHLLFTQALAGLLEPDFEIVATVADGSSLIETAARVRPDVVLSDISMPGMDGIAAARRRPSACSWPTTRT